MSKQIGQAFKDFVWNTEIHSTEVEESTPCDNKKLKQVHEMKQIKMQIDRASQEVGVHYERDSVPRGGQ